MMTQPHLKSGWTDCEGILNDTPDLHSTLRNTWQKNCVDLYVIEPMKQGVVTKLWTNSNAESMNHRLKQQVNWTPQKLPDLVEKMEISRGHMAMSGVHRTEEETSSSPLHMQG